MKTTAYILRYWHAIKGHKGFYYPSEKSEDLAFSCWIEGEVMPWLVPSNMVCFDTGTSLIFIMKDDIVSRS